jgi:hypothetical protein
MRRTSRRRGHRAMARVYRQAGEILGSALKLGKQGEAIGTAKAAERLESVKRKAAIPCIVEIS